MFNRNSSNLGNRGHESGANAQRHLDELTNQDQNDTRHLREVIDKEAEHIFGEVLQEVTFQIDITTRTDGRSVSVHRIYPSYTNFPEENHSKLVARATLPGMDRAREILEQNGFKATLETVTHELSSDEQTEPSTGFISTLTVSW